MSIFHFTTPLKRKESVIIGIDLFQCLFFVTKIILLIYIMRYLEYIFVYFLIFGLEF